MARSSPRCSSTTTARVSPRVSAVTCACSTVPSTPTLSRAETRTTRSPSSRPCPPRLPSPLNPTPLLAPRAPVASPSTTSSLRHRRPWSRLRLPTLLMRTPLPSLPPPTLPTLPRTTTSSCLPPPTPRTVLSTRLPSRRSSSPPLSAHRTAVAMLRSTVVNSVSTVTRKRKRKERILPLSTSLSSFPLLLVLSFFPVTKPSSFVLCFFISGKIRTEEERGFSKTL